MDVGETAETEPHRLVHIDLKGAPPRISYYEQLLPLLKKWGATGLLLEYEDMFPYWGNLKEIAAHNAYSSTEINSVLEMANSLDLTVIPLVQTFGHFEFVLKHDKFKHLREIEPYPMALCPLNEDSLPLVLSMIDQVMQLHPFIKHFHIGADEVFHIGLCSKCQQYCQEKRITISELFFVHTKRVVEHIKRTYPTITVIMWDDMFRETSVETLRDTGIGPLVEPMVWQYHRQIFLSDEMWDRYTQVFPNIWVASAFKGATGPCMFATDIGYHIENHKEWIRTITYTVLPKCVKFKGYTITGWQRYDHYSVLCELLPVGLPSLAICLLQLSKGSFTEEVHKTASQDLNLKGIIPLNPFKSVGEIPENNFPGSEVYNGIQILLYLQGEYKTFMRNDRLKGWMTDYHVRHNYTNPAHVNHFLPQAKAMLHQFQSFSSNMRASMLRIFYADCVNEWLAVNVNPKLQKLADLVQKAESQVELKSKPKQHTDEFPGDLDNQ